MDDVRAKCADGFGRTLATADQAAGVQIDAQRMLRQRGKQLGEVAVAAQDRLFHLLTSVRAVIYSYKAYGDFAPTFVSENLREVLGYATRDYLDSPDFWRNAVHPDDLPAIEAETVQLFRKGHHNLQYRFRRKDGSWCWVSDEQRLIRETRTLSA